MSLAGDRLEGGVHDDGTAANVVTLSENLVGGIARGLAAAIMGRVRVP